MEAHPGDRRQQNVDESAGKRPAMEGYLTGRLLGEGGSARVWLITSAETGAEFAAKVFDPASGDAGVPGVATARRELQLLGRLQHPHLLRLHEAVPTDESLALVMDYAAGGSLADLVGVRGPLPVPEVVTILTPIAQCLAYLHGQAVTHADLAPGNVLFTAEGKPLLSDLGLGRLRGESAAATGGTSGFSDPCLRPGTDLPGPASDVYGLAAVGWYALTGRLPAASARRPPLPLVVPEVPPELVAIIEAALQPEPAARPSAAEFERAVYGSMEAAPVDLVPAAHPSVLPRLLTRRDARSRQKRRRLPALPWPKLPALLRSSRPAGAAAALTVAAATGLAAWLLLGQGPNITSEGAASPAGAATSPSSSVAPPEPRRDSAAKGQTPSEAQGRQSQLAFLPEEVRRQLHSEDPVAAMHGLAWLRSFAFSSGRTELIEEVNVPGSAAMAADRTTAEQLNQRGHVLVGFKTTISDVRRVAQPASTVPGADEAAPSAAGRADAALLEVTAASSGFTEQTADGQLVHADRETGSQRLGIVLRQLDGRWLIDQILAAGAGQ